MVREKEKEHTLYGVGFSRRMWSGRSFSSCCMQRLLILSKEGSSARGLSAGKHRCTCPWRHNKTIRKSRVRTIQYTVSYWSNRYLLFRAWWGYMSYSSLDVHSVKNVGRGLVCNEIIYCLSMICCEPQKSVFISSFSWSSLSSQSGASGSKGMVLSLIAGHPQLTMLLHAPRFTQTLKTPFLE